MRLFAPILMSMALVACQGESAGTPETSPPTATSEQGSATPAPTAGQPESEPPADECGAGKLGRWLNVLPTDTVKAEIAQAVGERPIRYYGPDDAITMDYNPERLNAELGADGRIKLFRCG